MSNFDDDCLSGLCFQFSLCQVDELGLTNDVLPIPRGHVASKNRFIYVGGKLVALPNSLF
jgi:hypothetical protein